MGTYYQIACDELKERIDPGSINNLGVKAKKIAHSEHQFGSVVVFALLTRWKGKNIRLVDDCGNDPGYFEYKEVTEDVLKEYNEVYGTEYKFTEVEDGWRKYFKIGR